MKDDGRPACGLTQEELALLAHEIRGALTVVMGMTEIVKRDLPAAERQVALDGVCRAAERIDRLIDDAMAGRVDRPGMEREVLDLAEVVAQVAAEQRAVSGRTVTVDARVHPLVAGSREALERAIANLVENGLKYSLSSSSVDVSVETREGYAVVVVADRGPGIPVQEHARIFEPFERLEGSEAPGTGLGLTVVRSVMESHGGSIGVDDRPGGGSVFELLLPLA